MRSIIFTACVALLGAQYALAQNQLSDALPAEVGLYLRIPSVLGLVADGQSGRAFEAATKDPAHQAALKQIRDAYAKLDDLPPSGEAAIKFLIAEQSAPLEIALFKQDGVVSPLSAIVVQTTVYSRNEAAFKKHFDALLASSGMPMPYSFDAKTGRVQLLMGATPERLEQIKSDLSQKNKAVNSEFVVAQNRIDQSGKGLLLWADSQAMAPMLAMAAAGSEASNKWVFDALQGLDGIAIGAGSVGANQAKRSGRMALDFYFDPKAIPEWTQYFQPEARRYDYQLSGAPSWVANYSLPTNAKDVDRILRKIESLEAETKTKEPGFDFDAALAGGPSLRQILTSVGPEMAYFRDAAGTFGALRIRNRVVFKQFIANAGKHGFYELREGIHHLRLDSSAFTPADMPKELAVLGRLSVSSMYWVEEGEWLIAAPVPQLLRDRKAITGRISADKWLEQNTNVTASDQILAFAARSEGMPTQIWYGYLGLLEALGHIGKTNIDLFALPSARELGLPSAGFAGVSIDYTPQRLGFAVNYGANPADMMGGGNMLGTVAVVSIMAAIALPAYQDYTLRSKVTTALAQSQAAKVELQESYAENGELPKSKTFQTAPELKLHWDGKLLLLSFSQDFSEPLLRGKSVALAPVQSGDGIEFACAFNSDAETSLGGDAGAATSVAAKHLPTQCR